MHRRAPRVHAGKPAARVPDVRVRAKAAPAGVPWIYGRHAVEAALANPARRCRRLVALRETESEARGLLASARASMPQSGLETMDRHSLEKLLPPGAVHQGLAIATDALPGLDLETFLAALGKDAPAQRQILIVLDQVTDPHNVGAILRSAAAFAALAVIVPEHGAAPVTGALAKAASGALELVPLLRVSNLARALEHIKQGGFWCLGLAEDAEQSLDEIDLPSRIALVLGGEGEGLRRLTREHCDFLGRVPIRGGFVSLNVSNAAAVALYALSQPATRPTTR
jgi:23S rRNA (guanosine2251-2'-O)-methyltransferase